MIKNTKAKGSARERKSMEILEAAGYACTKSGASLGCFDIIGISPSGIVGLQVKSRDWPGSVEMEAIRNFKGPDCMRKIIHRWRDYQRLPDVKEV